MPAKKIIYKHDDTKGMKGMGENTRKHIKKTFIQKERKDGREYKKVHEQNKTKNTNYKHLKIQKHARRLLHGRY